MKNILILLVILIYAVLMYNKLKTRAENSAEATLSEGRKDDRPIKKKKWRHLEIPKPTEDTEIGGLAEATPKERSSRPKPQPINTRWGDLIMKTAYADCGKYVGLQCKPWVRDVIERATSYRIDVPNTNGNKYEWENDPDGHIIRRDVDIESVRKGDIVQMHFWQKGSLSPHTAIVIGVDFGGVIFIDSNWVRKNTVDIHYMTFKRFYALVSDRYTVYSVR